MNKKADGFSFLVPLILIIASLLLIGLLLNQFVTKAKPKEAEILCRDSIALRAASKIEIDTGGHDDEDSGVAYVPVLCKTIDVEIEGTKEEVIEELANKMERCWWMFNEAKFDTNLDQSVLSQIMGLQQNDKCFLCYTAAINEIEEEEDTRKGYIDDDELFDYLYETKHPKIKDITYFDYIQSYGGAGTVAILENIVPHTVYGVAFLARNDNAARWTWVDTLSTAGLLIGGTSCLISAGITCGLLVAAGGGELLNHGANAIESRKNFYGSGIDRPINMIVLDTLSGLNTADCIVGDAAGE